MARFDGMPEPRPETRIVAQWFDQMIEQCQGWHSEWRESCQTCVRYDATHKVWIVSFDSNEFSSGYHELGIGPTLPDAFEASTDDSEIWDQWTTQYPGLKF